MTKILEVKNLSFSYQAGSHRIDVLKNLNMTVHSGDFTAIQGPSGSGKSTLFYLLGFLLNPTSGEISFDGIPITQKSSDELTLIRNRKIGFIFQQFHLLSKTTVLDNILLPTRYPIEFLSPDPELQSQTFDKALGLTKKLGLENHLNHLPNQLSGGQQQRVAIARALMNDVQLILADEPTGNLDTQNSRQILELLRELNRQGKTIVLITHDSEVAQSCSKILHLRDGIFTQTELTDQSQMKDSHAVHSSPVMKEEVFSPIPNYPKLISASLPLVRDNLIRNKGKSVLTMLGVVIGVAAVLAMVTLGQYTKKKILETYEALGVNKLIIWGYPNWNLKATDAIGVNFRSFDWEHDLLPLRTIFPEIHMISPMMENGGNSATSGGLSVPDHVTSIGVTSEFLEINRRKIRIGHNISPFHVENRNPVCVIGSEIAERLFSKVNPIGQILSINDNQQAFPCKVIGVLEPVSTTETWSPPNRHVILPYTYFQTVVGNWWSRVIRQVTLQVRSGADVEQTGKKIKSYFNQRYGKSGQFQVDSDSTLIAQMKKFLNIFAILLAAIAFLSLVVGGIGINNMMLVSVSERVREFGIRKALGATHLSIRIQILMESVCLCLVAGLIGALLGFAAYEALIYAASKFVPSVKFEWVIKPLAVLLSVTSIVAVGIASGLIPALKAEKLQIIEALRAE